MYQMEQSLMPLRDRPHRRLMSSLNRLEARRSGGRQGQLSIAYATQFNMASSVRMVHVKKYEADCGAVSSPVGHCSRWSCRCRCSYMLSIKCGLQRDVRYGSPR
jgi:hypothetical protein